MEKISTTQELETVLGDNLKSLRLQKNLNRKMLCERAGISENALRHLEGGKGATLKTLVRVVRALDREACPCKPVDQVASLDQQRYLFPPCND